MADADDGDGAGDTSSDSGLVSISGFGLSSAAAEEAALAQRAKRTTGC